MHWSSECGSNVQLLSDYRSAKRTKSYSKGILISSSPLPNDRLFQVKKMGRGGEGEGGNTVFKSVLLIEVHFHL